MKIVNEFRGTYKGNNYIIKNGSIFHYLKVNKLFLENSVRYAMCDCKCGNKDIKVPIKSLLSDNTKTCGCYNLELIQERNHKHGGAVRGQKSKLYNAWVEMRRRCNTVTCKSYKNYGGRGISVCAEWNDFKNFKTWALNNGYIEGYTIERIDVNGNYEPKNCTWITKNLQSRNRTTSHFITYLGKTHTISEWSRELGISRSTILNRLKKNMELEDVFKVK